MAFINVPGVHSWVNLHYSSALGALGLSPWHGDGLRVPFLFGHGVAGIADHMHMRPQGGISSVFQHPFPCDVPIKSRFLVRPRLLTRV